MKSFLVIFVLYLLLHVTEKSFANIRVTSCVNASNFFHDNNCQCDSSKICIRKCCPENQVLNRKHSNECIDGHNQKKLWEQPSDGNITDIREFNKTDSHLVVGIPCLAIIFTREGAGFTVNRKGELTYFGQNWTFCMDYVKESGRVLAAACVDNSGKNGSPIPQQVIDTLSVVSILFLLITFLVFAIEPRLRNLQGKCLLCYLLCAISDSAIDYLADHNDWPKNRKIICYSAAYIRHYAALASFFWLNIMCFDLWQALRRMAYCKEDVKIFLLYCLYAWGSPLIVTCIMLSAQFSIIPGLNVKPRFAEYNCWFTKDIDEGARLWYYYGIATLLLTVNIILFIDTVHIIFTHNGQKKHLQINGSQRNTEKDGRRFFLYMKLSFIMGIQWIGELLPNFIDMSETTKFIIRIPDLLQGVFIFVIFVCKRRVLARLNQRLYPSRMFIHESKPRRRSIQSVLSTKSTSFRCGFSFNQNG